MNVRRMVENGERLIQDGRKKEGLELLQTAQDYIQRMNPGRREDLEAICRFTTIFKDGKAVLIHCGEDDENMLFPGTPEERKKVCFECQQFCLKRIEELKSS